MNSWVLSSNPDTYNVEGSLGANDGLVDWVTVNNFEIGDTVYIYEVIPPRGRGGIVYKTIVTKTDLSFTEKLDDRKYWSGHVYPESLNQAKFSRLNLVNEKHSTGLSLKSLKEHGFTAPQGFAHLLDHKPSLLIYIQNCFN